MRKAMGTTALLTFEEFEKLPGEPGKLELLDGELIHLPPAKLKHMRMIYRLADILKPGAAAAGMGEVCIEMGYKIRERAWLQPDVSISRPNQMSNDYFEGAPALAIEVISESNKAEDMDLKVKTYLANGGVEVWVVYPKTQSVSVFRTGHIEEFRGTLRSSLLAGLEIDLNQLFS
jgi:Uma2 family endonuclease